MLIHKINIYIWGGQGSGYLHFSILVYRGVCSTEHIISNPIPILTTTTPPQPLTPHPPPIPPFSPCSSYKYSII